MAANGFLEQKQTSPLSLGAVVLLHGAAIAAVLLIKGPEWIRHSEPPLVVDLIKTDTPPPENPPPQPEQQLVQPPISRIDVPPRVLPTPVPNITMPTTPVLAQTSPVIGNNPEPVRDVRQIVTVPPREPIRNPVRVDAQWDPRFTGAMQPPYPQSEVRSEREGSVRIRVTISPEGRVIAAERVSATSDAFWQATQRQALSRWRFRPATVDGRPVQGSKTLTVRFRLDGQ